MESDDTSCVALGEFLRECRARVHPADVGLLDAGRRRKVPGLRREELALLANLSVSYVRRLEQGRATNVSAKVLESLARALRLRSEERALLMRAASAALPEGGLVGTRIRSQTQTLLDGLEKFPALLLGRRLDVLGWNTLAAALFTDFSALPVAHRNLVRLAFLEPAFRELYVEWARTARESVASLRMHAARCPDDKQLARLVGELMVGDADFSRWWGSDQVRARGRGRERFRHPLAGSMTLDFQTLSIGDGSDQTLLVYTAQAGSESHNALDFLARWAQAPAGGVDLSAGDPAPSPRA
ncbi:helix-turn-helix domain-containing protein [Streptomyces sp. NPDC087659]|uniref:helix-turn-helix domain-containing protein n=1 Tax=Streptomyces sp. NPDC087659 TaxID=3365801 RepID=UPI0037FE8E0F